MMNPEFKRNLWMSFSLHRLIAMPVLLGLIFFSIALSDSESVMDFFYNASIGLFIFIVWLWGSRNANSSIVDELRDNTWDQQRMSALTPWTMTWGKLLGSTSFNWYGGLFCLFVLVFSGIITDKEFWLYHLLSLVAAGVLLHAALITLNLYAGKLEIKWIHRGGLGWLVIIVVFVNLQLFIGITNHKPFISWWGMSVEKNLFMLWSVLLFSSCAVVSSWRVVSSALQVRTLPWAWPSFTIILTLYLSGLGMTSLDVKLVNLSYAGLAISMLLCYVTLFTESGSLLIWNKLRLCQQKKNWRGWLEHLPLWPTTLLLAFCFALLATLSQQSEIWSSRLPFSLLPVVLVLMLLRDVAIVLFFSFSPNPKRAVGTSIIYLAVIYLLLPFLFKMAGLHLLSYLFLPLDSTYGSMPAVMVMLSHVTLALYMVVWRLKRNVTV